MKKIFLCILVCTFVCVQTSQTYAQLVVDNTQTPQQLVENVFLSGGTTVTNVTFTGDPQQIAGFTNNTGTSNLPIGEGVMLCTGFCVDYATDNTQDGFTSLGPNGLGDPDLDAILDDGSLFPPASFDAAVLEFDFLALDNVVSFTYSFASEEYNEYTCSQYNDVFAFILSGVTTPFGPTNIATVPGSVPVLPVAINTVNSGTTGLFGVAANCAAPNGSLAYSNLFIDNPLNSPNIQFDGMTVTLTATAMVVPCETYHIKLAIGDAGDAILDSGVFLEAYSFNSGVLNVDVATVNADGVVYEECDDVATITFSIEETSPVDYDIPFTIAGTATNGTDYTGIPASATIPAGQVSITVDIDPIADGVFEGQESVQLIVQTSICGFDTVEVFINEQLPLPPPTVNCDNSVPGDLTFSWSNVPGATGYEISLDGGLTWISPNPGPNTHVETGLGAGVTITILVRPIGGAECSSIAPGTTTCTSLNPSCPTVGFYDITTNSPFLCDDVAIGLQAWDVNDAGGYITPGFDFIVTTDIFSDTENSVEFYDGPNGTGNLIGSFPAGTVPESTVWTVFGEYFTGGASYSLIWCDNFLDGVFPYEIIDHATGATLGVGTFDHGGIFGTNCFTVNFGPLEGTATFSGPGVTSDGSGFGTFDPAVAGSGTHDITYTWIDGIGCSGTATQTVTVTEPTISATTTPPSCGGTDGTITITAGNGNSFMYSIDGGATFQPGNVFTGLAAGPYTVAVQVGGCTVSTGVVLVEDAPPFITTVTATPILCNGDLTSSITLVGGGGVAPYTFDWDNAPNVQNPTNLGAGTYLVTITDSNGCTATGGTAITEPPVMNTSTSVDVPLECSGSSTAQASVSASGGTPGYTYEWDNGETTALAVMLDEGLHDVTVTDANGCTEVNSVNITAPPPLTATATGSTVLCNGDRDGTTSVTASGGTAPYTYEWSDFVSQTTATATDLGVGTYTVTVTDANDCETTATAEVLEPTAITSVVASGTPPTCYDGCDGTVTVTSPTGGTPPYVFTWDEDGSTTIGQSITGLCAASYIVTVSDANGCFVTSEVTIDDPDEPIVTPTATDAVCNGDEGTISFTITNAITPYNYLWDNGTTTGTGTSSPITGLNAGLYDITVTDANSCQATTSIEVKEPLPFSIILDANFPTCSGDTDGSIIITTVNGASPFSYDWSDGTTTGTGTGTSITGLGGGTYTVTVTDANACTFTNSILLSDPVPVDVTATPTGVNCFGDTDGSIQIDVANGLAPYDYNWSGTSTGTGTEPAAPFTLTGLGQGTYDITITDANGCIGTASTQIIEPTELTASATGEALNCNGDTDGEITLTVNNGTAPYTFNWDNGAGTDQNPTGLGAGTYNVTVTDTNGCTAFATADITEPLELTASATGEALACNGDNGSITLTVNEGTAPYTYQWDNGAGTDQNPTGLGAGTYNVTVTDTNGCTGFATADITEPTALTASATGEALNCNGDTDGNITLTVNDGTAPYTYQWDNGAGTDQNPTGLGAGTYDVTVTDANGCTTFATADITEPLELTASATGEALACNGDNGSITLTVNDGTPPYIFNWDNGAGTDQNPTGLGAGTYNVTVTDANGCTAFAAADITEPTALTASATGEALACNGDTDGDITLTVNDGTMPYTYQWDNGAGTDQNPTGLGAGAYDVTVTDANGCTAFATADITEPTALTASATGEALACNGDTDGDIILTVNDGTAPYTYQWDNGAGTDQNPTGLGAGTYDVTVTDTNGCTAFATADITEPLELTASATGEALACNGDTDGDITLTVNDGTAPYTYQWDNGAGTDQNPTGLGAGTYDVTVTDANGCTAFATADITESLELTASATGEALACNDDTDGDITLTVNEGTAPYTYQWDNGAGTDQNPTGLGAGTYSVTVTDTNGCTATATADITEPTALTASATGEALSCNGDTDGGISLTVNGGTTPYTFQWDNGAGTDQNPTGLGLGTYTVTVTDANACVIFATADITEPTALTASATGEALSCNGDTDGDISLTVNGGTTPYTFQWDNGAGTDQNPTGLGLGTYNVTITDANACLIFATADITEPTELTASATGVDLLCNGETGDISLTVNGGTTPYTFVWTNGAGTDQNPTGLGAGAYDVVVTDANGCIATATADIIEPLELTASATGEALACNGDTDGNITLTVNDGTAPYTYQWDNGAGTDQNPTGLGAGAYDVTVTDANGCTVFATADITEPLELTASATGEALACNGDTDGDITLTVNDGTAPYTYQWDNGAGTDQNPTGLGAGTYDVTVTDANGCTVFATADITESLELTASATGEALACNGDTDGDITLTVNDGTAPYTFNWDNGAGTDQNPTGLSAGTYNVTVTDANGCIALATADITEPTALTASAAGQALACNGDTGDITLTVNDGTAPYTFNWDNGAGIDQNPTGLSAGTYSVTVTDANDCTALATADITEPTALTASATGEALACNGDTDGDITLTVNDGTPPYTFTWDNGAGTNQNPTGLGAGTYNVTVTDDNGCTIFATADITEPTVLTATAIQDSPVSCPGVSDGQATVTENGGTAPYTYSWDNTETTATATALSAGTHDVTVTDANGCTIIASVTIDDAAPLGIILDADSPANCTSCDGTASVTISGGAMPYTYTWSNGNSTEDPSDLCSGINTLTLTDANGCTATLDVNIGSISTLAATVAIDNQVTCFGDCDGQATVTASSGNMPYTYQWSDGQTTATASNLCAGNYFITVTDVNSCVVVETVDITEPTELLATATEDSPVNCAGDNDGQATVTATDGTPPYTYVWDNGETTATATTLTGGPHTVNITDANGCMLTANVTIGEPTALTASATGETLLCNGDTDGDITLTVNGGTLPYTYQWDNGAGTDPNPSGLSANAYSVTITDANNCTTVATANISEPGALGASASEDAPVSCPGASDGQATVTATGGTSPYAYEWDNGETTATAIMLDAGNHTITITDANSCIVIASVTIGDAAPLGVILDADSPANCTSCDGTASVTISGGAMPYTYTWSNGNSTEDPSDLCSGINTLTLTDANGCTATLDVNIGSISTLAATVAIDNQVTCFGDCDGQATVTASSGNMPYTYQWSDGQTTATASNLCAGNYFITVTDVNSCVVVETVDITEPTELLATAIEDSPVNCAGDNDGQATVTATDGTPPYTYVWDNGETTATATTLTGGPHTVNITDANGCMLTANVTIGEPTALTASAVGETLLCNGDTDGDITLTVNGGTLPYTYQWDNGAGTDPNPSGLSANAYSVTITDANNCTTVATANISEPGALGASASEDAPVSCPGASDGQATVTATGGTSPYAYEWDNGETTATAIMLDAGNHTITITDANSCIVIASVTIGDAAPLGVILDADSPANCTSCDGTASVTISGGAMPYTYTWSNGNSTEDPSDLCSGINTLTLTDANGCTATLDVNIGSISTLAATVVIDNQVTCFGDCDGQATVTASSGNMPYTYQWSDGQTTATASNLCAGNYFITVTDVNSCVVVETVDITEPTELLATATEDSPVNCAGDNDGQATVVPAGGTTPYTILWDNGETTTTATTLLAGLHDVTITDANTCTLVTSVTIDEPVPLVASATGENLLCSGDMDGDIDLTVSGGILPYTYQWDNGAGTDEDPTGLGGGFYTVTITDANNCVITASSEIIEPGALGASGSMTIPVSCPGVDDGQATAVASGGTAPYTYEWDNGETTEIATMLSPGNHTFTVTDVNACVAVASVTIGDADPLGLILDADSPANCTSCDGTASITVNGGSMPYTFEWSNGNNAEDPSNLCSGVNMVTITDANGCTATLDVNIGTISTLAASAVVDNQVTCFADCDGQSTVTASSGTPPYSYQWTDGQTSPVAAGLCAGTHNVTVTDANNCVVVETIMITEPDELLTTATEDSPVTCAGAGDGQATVSIAGGTTPYGIIWDNFETTATATALNGGIHSVTITDANACITTAEVTVGEPAPLTASATGEALLCNGDTDGDIDLTVNGGTMPYTFAWDNGAGTDEDPTGLGAGMYNVTVTDANGCMAFANADITEPTALTASAVEDAPVSCTGAGDGQATVTAGDGTVPYTYEWDNGETTATATTLNAGLHDVTVTDANGCTIIANTTVTDPDPISVALDADTPANCTSCNGSASITVNGGTAPYTYTWSGGNGIEDPIDLCGGLNTVTVTDANGCAATLDVNIGIISTLTASVTADNQVTCFAACDGQATASAGLGNPPYSYNWSNGQATDIAVGLCAGTYTVTVTDVDNCTDVATVTITEPTELVSNAVEDIPVTCPGDNDGQASVTTSGGIAPYSVLWSDGQLTNTATTLSAGIYTITITDGNSCVTTTDVTVTEPANPVTIIIDNTTESNCTSCDGTASITATGGTAPYTYTWSNGNTAEDPTGLCAGISTVTVTDANGCSATENVNINNTSTLAISTSVISNVSCFSLCDASASVSPTGGQAPYNYLWGDGQTTDVVTGLCAGTYFVTVTDQDGCLSAESIEITEPAELLANATGEDLFCNSDTDGNIDLTVNGGTAPYIFVWDNGAGTNEDPAGLGVGIYNVTITDANACITTASAEITEPTLLTASAVGQDLTCNSSADGNVTLTVNGGTLPYSFAWTNGAGTVQNPSGLAAGTYDVVVTDDNGCTATATATLTEPALLTANATDDAILCLGDADGNIDLTVNGGTMPYTYAWDNGIGAIEDPSGLNGGLYTVVVTDANNCQATAQATITEPTELTASAVGEELLCSGNADGDIDLTVNGGTLPYSFVWDNGAGTAEDPGGLNPGTYTVTVTDANLCSVTSSAEITQPGQLSATATGEALLCNGDTDGDISLAVNGGTAPYTFIWNNSETSQDITGLVAGTYTVTVTDVNNCQIVTSADITEPPLLTASALGEALDCNGDTDGNIDLTVNGGTMPYTYAWDNGAGAVEDPTGLSTGTYTVIITDANGCQVLASADITEPTQLAAFATGELLLCNGDTDGDIDLTVSGGTMPYTYAWDNGAGTTEDPSGLSPGIYNVVVTDANLCTITTSAEITEPTLLTAGATATTLACNGDTDATITLTVTGGTQPYTYAWDNGLGTVQNPVNLGAGTYSVVVTDANNCTTNTSVTITEPTLLIASATGEALLCNGDTDGNINLTVNGGTPPYSFVWDGGAGSVEDPSGLSAGTYNVVATDANGCTANASAQITEPAALTASATGEALNCFADTDGNISLTVNGGTAPYTYLWSNGDAVQNPSGLTAGTYSVVITDANNCSINASAQITEPTLLSATTSGQDVSCFGGSDGTATVTANGGTTPYTYSWDNGEVTNPAVLLNEGQHVVTVTDANGCQTQNTVNIGSPTPLVPTGVSSTPVTCFGGNDGTASISASGGTPPYTYSWNTSPAQTGATATGLPAGTVQVIITDANGCALPAINITVTQPDTPVTAIMSGTDPTCNGGSDGSVSVEAEGGIPSYSYAWSTGDAGQSVFDLSAGTYTVTITDANGCTFTDDITLGEPAPTAPNILATGVTCFGDENGSILIESVSGGTAPYAYSLDGENFVMSNFFGGLAGGNYTIYIQDANGCESNFESLIEEPFELNVDLGVDITMVLGDSVQLFAQTNTLDALSYSWTPTTGLSCTDCPNPWVTGLETTSYQVQITNANGCTATDNITVVVDKDRNVYIPNIFSPTNDGTNDVFMIYGGQGVVGVDIFRVYDRWGELLWEAKDFSTDDPTYGWDGTFRGQVMNPAVFVYYAEVTFIDGVTIQYKGDVTLTR